MISKHEARMIAEELYKLIRRDMAKVMDQAAYEVVADETMNITEASKYLKVKKQTIYNKIEEIPHDKINNRLVFRRRNLDQFIASRSGVIDRKLI